MQASGTNFDKTLTSNILFVWNPIIITWMDIESYQCMEIYFCRPISYEKASLIYGLQFGVRSKYSSWIIGKYLPSSYVYFPHAFSFSDYFPLNSTSHVIVFYLLLYIPIYKFLTQWDNHATHRYLNFSGVVPPIPSTTYGKVKNSKQPRYVLPSTPRERQTRMTCKLVWYCNISCINLLFLF